MANSIGNGFRVSFRSLKEIVKSSTFYWMVGIFFLLSVVAILLTKEIGFHFPSIVEAIRNSNSYFEVIESFKMLSFFKNSENLKNTAVLMPSVLLIGVMASFLSLIYSRILINKAHGKKGIPTDDIIKFLFFAIPVSLVVGGLNALIGLIDLSSIGLAIGSSILRFVLRFIVSILSSFYLVFVAAEHRLFISWKLFFTTISTNILNYVGFRLFVIVAVTLYTVILSLIGIRIFLGLNLHNSPNAVLYAGIGVSFLIAPLSFFVAHVLTRFYLESNKYRG